MPRRVSCQLGSVQRGARQQSAPRAEGLGIRWLPPRGRAHRSLFDARVLDDACSSGLPTSLLELCLALIGAIEHCRESRNTAIV